MVDCRKFKCKLCDFYRHARIYLSRSGKNGTQGASKPDAFHFRLRTLKCILFHISQRVLFYAPSRGGNSMIPCKHLDQYLLLFTAMLRILTEILEVKTWDPG